MGNGSRVQVGQAHRLSSTVGSQCLGALWVCGLMGCPGAGKAVVFEARDCEASAMDNQGKHRGL